MTSFLRGAPLLRKIQDPPLLLPGSYCAGLWIERPARVSALTEVIRSVTWQLYLIAVQGELVEYLLQHPDSRSCDVVYKRLFEVRCHILLEPFLPGIIHRLREIFKEPRIISEQLSKLLIINSYKTKTK